MSWILPGQILAFAGPTAERKMDPNGSGTSAPSDYLPFFQQHNVGLVVRLNEKSTYNPQVFIDAGIGHLDTYFPDGTCPEMDLLHDVLTAMEQAAAHGRAVAVHCQAGIGRTGTCIGAYLLQHYGWTAKEAIGWMRMCRPGCVIGEQQRFLEDIQYLMWDQGARAGYLDRLPVMDTPGKHDCDRGREDPPECDTATISESRTDSVLAAASTMAETTNTFWFLVFGYVVSCSCRAASTA